MNIVIMGFRDKRHIIYSILKILSPVGRTVFITTNPCYRQLSEDYSPEFEIGDTDVLVLNESLYSACEILELEVYDYLIWDAVVEVPENVDLSIMTDHEELYRSELEELNIKPKFKFIENKTAAKKDEKTVTFVKASAVEEILTKIETDRIFYPITSYAHNKTMSEILSAATGMEKSKLTAYLKKGRKK